MAKKIAVVVRERQGEALRMAVGLTLVDDKVDVFVLDRAVADTKETKLALETLEMMEMKLHTNVEENRGMELLSVKEVAQKLLEYDIILPY